MRMEDARRRIYFFDSRGLVVKGRDHLNDQKKLYAHDMVEETLLLRVIEKQKPTILIGVSGQTGAFNESIIRKNLIHYYLQLRANILFGKKIASYIKLQNILR